MPTSPDLPQVPSRQSVETLRLDIRGVPADVRTPLPLIPAPRILGYELFEEVGAGGMGIVYRARHRGLNRIVALKVLRPTAIGDEESRARFRAEAEAVAKLQHPNIIQVFEIGESGPAPFIALEFVESGSLTQWTIHPQAPRPAAELVEKIARAVHSAHQLGVIHRDLKPANVLLTRSGEPKIADFGLAKQIEDERDSSGRFVTQAGFVVGTPEYMPPEQTAGRPATPAIDIYALGIILYELLTSNVPFRGATPFDTMTLVHDQEPVPPRRVQPTLPRDLETICLKCLEKNPARRYPSAQALADDLRSFLDGRTIHARRAGSGEKAVRWAKRNPIVAVSLTGIAVTVCLAYTVVFQNNRRLENSLANEAMHRRNAQTNAEEADRSAAEARFRADAERFEIYRAHLTAATSLFDTHDVGAKRNLFDCPPEFRGWEWRHFASRLDRAERRIENPPVVRMCFLTLIPGGSRLCATTATTHYSLNVGTGEWSSKPRPTAGRHPTLSADGRRMLSHVLPKGLEYWNIETNQSYRIEQTGEFHFTADGTKFLTGCPGNVVRLRESDTGRVLHEFAPYGASGVENVYFSPDGTRIVTFSRDLQRLDLWDETGRPVAALQIGKTGLRRVHFGRTRFITEEGFPETALKLWDAATGRLLGRLEGHTNALAGASFSPDETRIVTASMDQTARLWNASNGNPIQKLTGHKGWVNQAAFSPDGSRIMTASQDHTLRLWDGLDGTLVNVLPGHDEEVTRACWTPDGAKIVSVSGDCVTRIWDAKSIEFDGVLSGHGNFVYGVAIHPDGRRAVSASWDGSARVWDLKDERELARFDHGDGTIVTSVAIRPDGKMIATRTREAVHLWDLEAKREVHRWNAPMDPWRHTRIAFSPDGRLLASGGVDNSIHIWEVDSRKEYAVLRGHTDTVRDVVFSPDGRWLASGGEVLDNTVRIWNVAEKREATVLRKHTAAVYSLAFNSDGSLLASGSLDDHVRIWRTDDWSLAKELPHGSHIYGLAFSPDGKRLASACANNAVRVWDTGKWEEAVDLRGHGMYVHSVAFTPDGETLLSCSGDKTLRIWSTKRPGE
jgi:WD40 repeat protein/tRNA A-37 threonylcarbamoyl transferase component Bud32